MLKDLTLEMWVPSLRWSEAHRMHRNIPNYIHRPMSAMFLLICTSHFHPLTLQLAHPIEAIVSTGKAVVARGGAYLDS